MPAWSLSMSSSAEKVEAALPTNCSALHQAKRGAPSSATRGLAKGSSAAEVKAAQQAPLAAGTAQQSRDRSSAWHGRCDSSLAKPLLRAGEQVGKGRQQRVSSGSASDGAEKTGNSMRQGVTPQRMRLFNGRREPFQMAGFGRTLNGV